MAKLHHIAARVTNDLIVGNKLTAIKRVRKATGAGLKDSKMAVDRLSDLLGETLKKEILYPPDENWKQDIEGLAKYAEISSKISRLQKELSEVVRPFNLDTGLPASRLISDIEKSMIEIMDYMDYEDIDND